VPEASEPAAVCGVRPEERRPNVLFVADDAHRSSFTAEQLSGALKRDGFDVIGAVEDPELVGDGERVRQPDGTLDAVVQLVDGPKLQYALWLMRTARSKWATCALVAVSPVPDERLLGSDWDGRPVGARFVALPAIKRSEDFTRAVRAAVRAPFAATEPVDCPLPLTRVQVEVLGLLADGYTNKAIAQHRRTTEKAVRHMVGRIAQRLAISADGATNVRVALARHVLIGHVRGADGRDDGWEGRRLTLAP